jgi:hypothetical protein
MLKLRLDDRSVEYNTGNEQFSPVVGRSQYRIREGRHSKREIELLSKFCELTLRSAADCLKRAGNRTEDRSGSNRNPPYDSKCSENPVTVQRERSGRHRVFHFAFTNLHPTLRLF